MKLNDYLALHGLTQADFAQKAGIQQSAVSRICSGGDARGPVWARIMVATDGEVSPADHFPPWKRGRDAA